ncbi:MAG: hypothetical protein HYS13_25315 [Planctomycetia bacterium]|nr:hypothetical protein [Planctomycetia bacterium]
MLSPDVLALTAAGIPSRGRLANYQAVQLARRAAGDVPRPVAADSKILAFCRFTSIHEGSKILTRL